MQTTKQPFDWVKFLDWLEENSWLLFAVIRTLLGIGAKKMAKKIAAKKIEEYEAHIAKQGN